MVSLKKKEKSEGKEFRKKAAAFTIKFFAIFTILYALLFILDFSALENWLAGFEAKALNASSYGNIIELGNGSEFIITESCIGLFSGIVLFSIIFACKKPSLKQKALIAVLGALGLFLLNILRVFIVLLAGREFGVQAAETLHVASWLAMSAFIIAIWYYSMKKMISKEFRELI